MNVFIFDFIALSPNLIKSVVSGVREKEKSVKTVVTLIWHSVWVDLYINHSDPSQLITSLSQRNHLAHEYSIENLHSRTHSQVYTHRSQFNSYK